MYVCMYVCMYVWYDMIYHMVYTFNMMCILWWYRVTSGPLRVGTIWVAWYELFKRTLQNEHFKTSHWDGSHSPHSIIGIYTYQDLRHKHFITQWYPSALIEAPFAFTCHWLGIQNILSGRQSMQRLLAEVNLQVCKSSPQKIDRQAQLVSFEMQSESQVSAPSGGQSSSYGISKYQHPAENKDERIAMEEGKTLVFR